MRKRRISKQRSTPNPLEWVKHPKTVVLQRRLRFKKKLWLIWKLGENCGICGVNFMPDVLKGFTKAASKEASLMECGILPIGIFEDRFKHVAENLKLTIQTLDGIHVHHPKNDRAFSWGTTNLSWADLRAELPRLQLSHASCNDEGTGAAMHK